MHIFKRTFSQDLDLLENHLTKEIMSQIDCKTTLTKLRTTFENDFNSELKAQTASSKLVKECSLNSETQDVHEIRYKMSKAKERCMAYFLFLHSHLQVLSKDDLKGTRIEYGFRRAFMSIFDQDADTFTRTMLLNVDQLQKQLDKDECQEDGSITAFWVVNNQFQTFIDSKFTLDYDSQITDTSKTTEQTTSLLANNAELKAQIQEKVFAIAALKNDLRKLKGNSVDTKFDKTPVLGKPVLPSLRNK
ncbi:hypothetical protein Tco_1110871 [Tanacetum coccineum]|uniref:Uncharacterized protein n=1 Tax=Tanacetum coccineum TaxID=301880 RepID=A0ABQ5IK22_9ASTR